MTAFAGYTLFCKKTICEHYWKTASASRFNKKLYQKHTKWTWLSVALFCVVPPCILRKLSRRYLRAGLKKHGYSDLQNR